MLKDNNEDEEFKIHSEQLLNPQEMVADDLHDTSDSPYTPILNDLIEQIEVMEAAECSKESKSFIGITPAIFRCFPAAWILFITQILNIVFCNENWMFPTKWCYNKHIVLFKKGARLV